MEGEDLAASICGLIDCEKVVPSEIVVDKDDETLVLVFYEAFGVGDELTALSNMHVFEETINGDFKTVSFEESPLMSTYLVVFAVGLFDYIKETTSDDMVVVPNLSGGAMEDYGLSTYREAELLHETEILDEISEVYNPNKVGERNKTESLVHMKRSYMTDNVSQLIVGDDDMGLGHDLEDVFGDIKDFSTALWRIYELKTTRLSQELAE
nr:aminopeptidase M1-like isoform X1 [Tanacetum cinerariifolium]